MDQAEGEDEKSNRNRTSRNDQVPPASEIDGKKTRVAQSTKEKRQDEHKINWPARVQAGCAVALVLITFFYTYYARKEAAAAIDAAQATKKAADVAEASLKSSDASFQKTLAETKRQVDASQTAAEASRRSASAAQESARTSRQSLEMSQRPYVVFRSVWKSDFQSGKKLTVRVFFENVGRTAALNTTPSIRMDIIPYPLSENAQPEEPQGDRPVSRVALPPGQPYFSSDIPSDILTDPVVKAINDGTLKIYIFGFVTYDDQFGRHHKTEFCALYNPIASDFIGCPHHNRAY